MFAAIFLIFSLQFASKANCAKILGVFIWQSLSHHAVYQVLWKELSLRGHQVTILTPHPLNDPALTNLTEIDLGLLKEEDKNDSKYRLKLHKSIINVTKTIYEKMETLTEQQLQKSAIQNFLRDDSKAFDLLLVEFLVPAVYAISVKYNCPMIGVTSLDALTPSHDAVGNILHPVLSPDLLLPFKSTELNFFDRLHSVSFAVWYRFYYYWYVLPQHDRLARKYIQQNIPYIGDIERNVSMLFINTSPFIHALRPNVKTIIEMGNIHLKPKKLLPQDLQIELDEAKQGVIYFSLGSNVRSADLSLELRDTIMKALSELPYKVIWKFEDDHLPGKPKNVVIRKWLPQQDLLGHPNIKAFVTQGGLQSMEEAISNGVPLIGMPFFGDQPLNVAKMVKLGIAQTVDTEKVTSDLLKEAIIEVAENPKYRQRIKEIAKITSDVPMTGLEKAVWWTEYVIRHKGARHLRSPAIDMPWYQYLLLDVIGFVVGVLIIAVFIIYKTIRFLLSIFLTQKKLKTQ